MLIEELWETIISYPWMAITLAVWLTIWKFAATALSKDETLRTRIGVTLLDSSFRSRYRAMLTRCLDWLDEKLSPREIAESASLRPRAWSFGLLNLSIVVALAYPVLALLITWAVTNDGAIAGLTVFPSDESNFTRYATAFGIVTLFSAFMLSEKYLQGRLKLVTNLVLVGLIALSAFFVAGVIVGVGIVAVVAAVTFAGIGAGICAGAVAFAFAGIGIGIGIGIGQGVILVVGAVAFLVGGAVDYLGDRTILRTRVLTIWTFTSTGAIVAAVLLSGNFTKTADGTSSNGLILFICFLPLINAMYDFFSIGLTRYCLRRGLNGHGMVWASIDLIGACLCFALLSITLILLIQHVTPQDGALLLDLTALFSILNDPANWSQYTWLGFMMFSTLLPTIAHGILALAAFFLGLVRPLQPHLGEWIAGGPFAVHVAWFAISLISVFAISAALTIPFVVADHYIHIIAQTISFFEGFARWSGAI